jgi:hypothetical protein
MKHKLLASVMMICALGQVACDDNKSPQQTASDCLSKPGCAQQVIAAQGGMLIPLTPAAAAPGSIYPPGTLPPTTLAAQVPPSNIFGIAHVANAAVKAQSMKVAKAIAADEANPMSDYYKIPEANPVKSVEQVASENSASSTRDPASAGSASTDLGEASR